MIMIFMIIAIDCADVYAAKLYINNEDVDVETVYINGQNYISEYRLYPHINSMESEGKSDKLISVRDAFDTTYYIIQWDYGNIYVSNRNNNIERKNIGYTIQGRPIELFSITPPNYKSTIVCTFAMHGFEDVYNRDGEKLVDVAEKIMSDYEKLLEVLNFTRLMIIPCVNPDGTYEGHSKDGFGRCNSQGIDINRDFDYNWGYIGESRYKTGNEPFASVESRVLRDLIIGEKPDIVLDFHGWLDCCYSQDEELKNLCKSILELGYEKPAYTRFKHQQGYFSGWASQHNRSALIEYKFTSDELLRDKTIELLQVLCHELLTKIRGGGSVDKSIQV